MTLLLAPVIIPSLPAEAQTFKVLYTFAGCTEGANPVGTLLLRAGILYGTTSGGDCTGESSNVFQFDTETGQETTLYTFGAPGDGVAPRAGLIRDSLGNLYGTTSSGYGTVFEIDSANTETVLHSFTGVDGYSPRAPLVRDSAGNLYGTTEIGGLYVDWGTVFKLDTAGTLTVLYNFGAKPGDGESPLAGLLIENGNLYGTTQGDLADFLYGTVYQLNPQTGEMTVLYSFGGGSDGSTPAAGLIGDRAGNL